MRDNCNSIPATLETLYIFEKFPLASMILGQESTVSHACLRNTGTTSQFSVLFVNHQSKVSTITRELRKLQDVLPAGSQDYPKTELSLAVAENYLLDIMTKHLIPSFNDKANTRYFVQRYGIADWPLYKSTYCCSSIVTQSEQGSKDLYTEGK